MNHYSIAIIFIFLSNLKCGFNQIGNLNLCIDKIDFHFSFNRTVEMCGKKFWVALIIGIIVVAGVGVGIFLWLSNGSFENDSISTTTTRTTIDPE